MEKLNFKVPAVRGQVLGVNIYRGFAPLSILSKISKPDVYDQVKNPSGTQRDLSPKHAREAYEYVKNKSLGFWPEIFLCARRNDILTFTSVSTEYADLGILEIDVDKVLEESGISLSRVDGNHRLYYADGVEKGYAEIERQVSFCIAYDISPTEEIQLFKDINKNQKPMNTSHLDGIDIRLTPEEELKRRNPELYIAQRLRDDKESPLHGLIYDGGKKPVGVIVPLRGLKSGIQYMLSRSTQLPRLADAEAKYRVIRNYFEAVRKWETKAWENPKDYIILRGAGLWGICFLGAQVIDRGLMNDKFEVEAFSKILESGRRWDWGNKGSFKGYSGRSGAVEISQKVARHLKDTNQISTDELFNKIMGENE